MSLEPSAIALAFAEARRAAGVATPVFAPVPKPRPPARIKPTPASIADMQPMLIQRYLDGDRTAGDMLLQAYDKMIRSQAERRSRRCALLEESDLVQIGRIAFLSALRTYAGNGPLGAYASVAIERAVTAAIDEEDTCILVPTWQQYAIRKAVKGGGLTEKLAAVSKLRQLSSLDEPMSNDDDRTLSDTLVHYGASPEEVLIALEDINAANIRSVWDPDATVPDNGPHLDSMSEKLRSVSRGRAVAR